MYYECIHLIYLILSDEQSLGFVEDTPTPPRGAHPPRQWVRDSFKECTPVDNMEDGSADGGARFETPTAPETIDLDLLLSFRSQPFTKAGDR